MTGSKLKNVGEVKILDDGPNHPLPLLLDVRLSVPIIVTFCVGVTTLGNGFQANHFERHITAEGSRILLIQPPGNLTKISSHSILKLLLEAKNHTTTCQIMGQNLFAEAVGKVRLDDSDEIKPGH